MKLFYMELLYIHKAGWSCYKYLRQALSQTRMPGSL